MNYMKTLQRCEHFKLPSKKYRACHRTFNTAAALSVNDTDELEANIESFMIFL